MCTSARWTPYVVRTCSSNSDDRHGIPPNRIRIVSVFIIIIVRSSRAESAMGTTVRAQENAESEYVGAVKTWVVISLTICDAVIKYFIFIGSHNLTHGLQFCSQRFNSVALIPELAAMLTPDFRSPGFIQILHFMPRPQALRSAKRSAFFTA